MSDTVLDLRLLLESIIAIYNPALTSSFINKWNGLVKRMEMNCMLFYIIDVPYF